MMVHAAWRGRVELFNRRIRSPCHKDPVIAGTKNSLIRLRREGDFDAVFQNEWRA